MKNKRINKIVIAWLLSATFAFPVATRNIHVYLDECAGSCCSHTEDGSHSGHDCNTCPICHFTLSLFTEAEPFSSDAAVSPYVNPAAAPYRDKKYNPVFNFHYLRAPPSPNTSIAI